MRVYLATRPTDNIIKWAWHGDQATFCPPTWADLAIGSFEAPRGGGFGGALAFARAAVRWCTGAELVAPLSGRELEVLDLLADGLSNKLIAHRLSISEHTVKTHVASIFAKLGASSRTEAVSKAIRRGLVML